MYDKGYMIIMYDKGYMIIMYDKSRGSVQHWGL